VGIARGAADAAALSNAAPRRHLGAQAALARGPGIHGGGPLNLPRLLVSSTDLPPDRAVAAACRTALGAHARPHVVR
jgi:hypothetical protein